MPLFSIIIPVYNRVALLPATVTSAFAQSFTDFEVIIVDDGSTDGSPEWVASQNLPIKLLSQPNSGPGPARNLALSQATGEYVAFLDSDDLWFPWTLATYFAALHNANRPKLIAASLVEFSDPSELAGIKEESLDMVSYPDFLTAAARDGVFMGAGMACIHRQTLLDVGGFPNHRFNAEDHDLALRLGHAPGFTVIRKPTLLGYRRHSGSVRADHPKSIAGMRYLLDQERRGHYPGGHERAAERRMILARHVRPITLDAAKAGYVAPTLRLYLQSTPMQIRQGRWRYLFGLPLMMLAGSMRRLTRSRVS